MLPGVEIARRRRVWAAQGRDLDAYDGGGGGARSDAHRTRVIPSGSNHHHYHLHHHIHSRHGNHSSRPGTPRPGSLVRRMQDVLQDLQEQRFHRSSSGTTSSGFAVMETALGGQNNGQSFSLGSGGSSRSDGSGRSRTFRSRWEVRDSHFASSWRRHNAAPYADLLGPALEARNRLDERLRATAHSSMSRFAEATRNRRSSSFVHVSPLDVTLDYTEEEDRLWSDDDGWDTSLHDWLAAWAPSFQESWTPWTRVGSQTDAELLESTHIPLGSWTSFPPRRVPTDSSNRTYKDRSSQGLSEAAIKSLPVVVMGKTGMNSKLEQEDCPVCLEGVLRGQLVITLPCGHRFHPDCLTPWLAKHRQCPYCRAEVVKDKLTDENFSTTSHEDEYSLSSWVELIERGMDRLNDS